MATTTKVPSDNFEDLLSDVRNVTQYMNGEQPFSTRTGRQITPLPAQQTMVENLIRNSGFQPVGNFATGATITAVNQVLFNNTDSCYYNWQGAVPFNVPAGTNPTANAGPAAWVNRGNIRNHVTSVRCLKDLAGIKPVDGQQFQVAGFYEGISMGGGHFVYDANLSKSEHNGIDVICLEALFNWSGEKEDLASLFNWSGSGEGCLLRLDIDGIHPAMAGAIDSESYSHHQHVVNSARSRNTKVKFGNFDWRITSPLIIGNNALVELSFLGIISAADSFSGYKITIPGNPANEIPEITFTPLIHIVNISEQGSPALGWEFNGNGEVHCRHLCEVGIYCQYGRFSIIKLKKIVGAKKTGALIGNGTNPSTDVGLDVEGVWWSESYSPSVPKNTPDSIGIWYRGCTDSVVPKSQVVGYRVAYRSDSGSVHFYRPHAWTRLLYGPLLSCFDIYGNSNTLVTPDADSPTSAGDESISEVFGYRLGNYNTKIIAPRVWLNGDVTKDGETIGYFSKHANGQHQIISPHCLVSAANIHRFKEYYRGFTGEQYTIIGHEDSGHVVDYNSRPIGNQGIRPFKFRDLTTRDLVSRNIACESFTSTGLAKFVRADESLMDVNFDRNGKRRIAMRLSEGENGNFSLVIYDANGVVVGAPLTISRQFNEVRLGDPANTNKKNVNINSRVDAGVGLKGDATVLPSQPEGYLVLGINGVDRKVPFYKI